MNNEPLQWFGKLSKKADGVSNDFRGRPVFRSRNIRNVPEYFNSGISVISGMFRNTVDDGEVARSGWWLVSDPILLAPLP